MLRPTAAVEGHGSKDISAAGRGRGVAALWAYILHLLHFAFCAKDTLYVQGLASVLVHRHETTPQPP